VGQAYIRRSSSERLKIGTNYWMLNGFLVK
jgi:hypothetical protein